MSLKKVDGPDDLMTATDAGRILDVSVDMVRVLARSGALPCTSTIGGMRLFRRADVEAVALQRAERKASHVKMKAAKLRSVK